MNKTIKDFLSKIGKKGGSQTSEAKKKATALSLKKAREAKAKKRKSNGLS